LAKQSTFKAQTNTTLLLFQGITGLEISRLGQMERTFVLNQNENELFKTKAKDPSRSNLLDQIDESVLSLFE
jgi:uncharacterized protein YhaN